MKRTTIFIDEALEAELQALAAQRRQPTAMLVREAIATYVAGQRPQAGPTLSFIAAGRSGARDGAERHEELLWHSPHGDQTPEPSAKNRTKSAAVRSRSLKRSKAR